MSSYNLKYSTDLTVYKVPPKEKQGYGSIYNDLKGLPVSYALGSCGMPGNTAHSDSSDFVTQNQEKPSWCRRQLEQLAVLWGRYQKSKKKAEVDETLKQYAPKEIACYFDNRTMSPCFHCQCPFRLCNHDLQAIKVEGFMVVRWWQEWFEGVIQLRDWILENYREAVTCSWCITEKRHFLPKTTVGPGRD
ncbi:hypothetical protein Fcan01_21632 [Folsomia candida]|uniref:Uncharacterized protein n=1 Tax=Folsomia candida TaxID=158441 RepID=A0A226DFR6_FOLCA|nr:hypothetical protein Fcan01_21632 [Folsomia candida]